MLINDIYENDEHWDIKQFFDADKLKIGEGCAVAFTDGGCEKYRKGKDIGMVDGDIGYAAVIYENSFADEPTVLAGKYEQFEGLKQDKTLLNEDLMSKYKHNIGKATLSEINKLDKDILDKKFYQVFFTGANMAGEAKAAALALEYCKQKGIKNLTLVYDFEWIGPSCVKSVLINNKIEPTNPQNLALKMLQTYSNSDEFLNAGINLKCVHVKSHILGYLQDEGLFNPDDYSDIASRNDAIKKACIALSTGGQWKDKSFGGGKFKFLNEWNEDKWNNIDLNYIFGNQNADSIEDYARNETTKSVMYERDFSKIKIEEYKIDISNVKDKIWKLG